MSRKIIKRNQPCLDREECKSSDARQIYEDLTSFCFSCNTFFPRIQGEEVTPDEFIEDESEQIKQADDIPIAPRIAKILELRSGKIADRGIDFEVVNFFGVKLSFNEEGKISAHHYPYSKNTAFKVRELPKTFKWVGKSNDLFGRDKFSGGGKKIVITEGEIDALSVAQASFIKYNKIFPVVAMSSAGMNKSLIENREWLRSFQEVVLCLDEDKAGQEATQAAIKVIGIDKVKIAKLPAKDPNEVLLQFGPGVLNTAIWDAAPYIPSGILTKEELWDTLENFNNTPCLPYPECLSGLNTKLKGLRLGEIVLFTSGTGSGKSTILREIIIHILNTTKEKIGVVSLEESPAETARKLAGMVLMRNPAKDEIPLEELRVGFDKVFGEDRVIVLDHQGSINDDTILDKLEYMCLQGCKYLFIDHITILVSEGIKDLTGNESQDYIMNSLLKIVKKHNVWVGLVSHLRKTMAGGGKSFEEGKLPSIDDIRGSGSVKQISFDIISFARNLTADDTIIRNTIKMRILKSRFTGLTGSVKGACYNYDTGRLEKSEIEFKEEFVSI